MVRRVNQVRFSARCLVLVAAFYGFSGAAGADYRADVAALYSKWNMDDRPGVAIAILDGGRMVYAEGFGMANLENGVPIDADSLFNIASISKQFTAAAIAKLHLEGKLGLQDPVGQYVPGLPAWGDKVTVEQLVHHQSGVPDIFGFMAKYDVEFDHVWGNEDVMPHIAKMELEFEPGEKFSYSNTNYVLMAEIARQVSGMSLRAYLDRHFFQPLGMTRTRVDDDLSKDQDELVVGYTRPRRDRFERVDREDVLVGDGNIVTSLDDFAKWDANLRDPKVGGEAWRDLMLSRIRLNNGELNDYAFGLFVTEEDGDTVIEHGGSWLRFRSDWVLLRERGVSVIEFANHGSQLHSEEVLDIYLEARGSE